MIALLDFLTIGLHVDLLAKAHDEFINAIVEYFLHQDINAVILRRPVSEFADIHAWTETNMLLPIKRLYGFRCVFMIRH